MPCFNVNGDELLQAVSDDYCCNSYVREASFTKTYQNKPPTHTSPNQQHRHHHHHHRPSINSILSIVHPPIIVHHDFSTSTSRQSPSENPARHNSLPLKRLLSHHVRHRPYLF